MKRTQIYLPEELHRELLMIATQEKKTLSEIIRRGAQRIIRAKERRASDWLEAITGMVKKGPRDLSRKIDYYLYKKPQKTK